MSSCRRALWPVASLVTVAACSSTQVPPPIPLDPVSTSLTGVVERPYDWYALRGGAGGAGRVILSSTDQVIRTVPGLLDGGDESRTLLEVVAPRSIVDVVLLDSPSGEELLLARVLVSGPAHEQVYVIQPGSLSATLLSDVGFAGVCDAPPGPGSGSALIMAGTHVVGALFSVCTDALDSDTAYTYEVSLEQALHHAGPACTSSACLRTVDVRYEVRLDEDGNRLDGPAPWPTLAANVGRGIAFQEDDGSLQLVLHQIVIPGLHETPLHLANVYTCRDRRCVPSRQLGDATWVTPPRPFRRAAGIAGDDRGEWMTIVQADSLRTLHLPPLSRIVTSQDALYYLRPEGSLDSYRSSAERVGEAGESIDRFTFRGWGEDEAFFAWTVTVPPGDPALILTTALPAAPPYRLYELPGW